MPKSSVTNFIGQKYGKLLVTAEMPPTILKDNRKLRYAKCLCECGQEKISTWSNLKSGQIQHCGCESPRHGGYGTKIYAVWRRIIQCCFDVKSQGYKNYGQRGITVCAEWQSFPKFREWTIASGYSEGLSIDRIDNNGNYEPANCRWATAKEQSSNKRTNIYVEHNGQKITATEFARLTNTPQSTVLYRIHKLRKSHAI